MCIYIIFKLDILCTKEGCPIFFTALYMYKWNALVPLLKIKGKDHVTAVFIF